MGTCFGRALVAGVGLGRAAWYGATNRGPIFPAFSGAPATSVDRGGEVDNSRERLMVSESAVTVGLCLFDFDGDLFQKNESRDPIDAPVEWRT